MIHTFVIDKRMPSRLQFHTIKHWEDNALQETISGARAFEGGRFDPSTIRTDEGSAVSFSPAAEVPSTPFPCAKPGFADVYAHLR